MQRRIYEDQDHPLTQYLNILIELLNKETDGTLILKTKEAVLPLCMRWLGEAHVLTKLLE
jgi:hypothetical protein